MSWCTLPHGRTPRLASLRWPRACVLVTAALLAGACAAVRAAALADPPALVGRLAWFSGEVWHEGEPGADGRRGREPLRRNWPITPGQRLATGALSRAEVWVGSTALRLDENSVLTIVALDEHRLRLRLQRGIVAVRVALAQYARNLEVQTARGRYGPVEPSEFCVVSDGAADVVTAWAGSLYAAAADATEAWVVRGGQRLSLGSGAPMAVPAAGAALDPHGFRTFVRQRDAAFDGRVALRYVSPEMTGVESLDSHGEWFHTALYGAVWAPYVNAGWAPLREGRWVRIEPWGWTWVDDAPWGFAPFHYGRWTQWRGRWVWAPGRYVERPVYAPALVAWPRPAPSPDLAAADAPPGPAHWRRLGPRELYQPPYAASARYLRDINAAQHPPACAPGDCL